MTKPDTLKLQVVHTDLFLPIFILEIWDTCNKQNSTQYRKGIVYIIE